MFTFESFNVKRSPQDLLLNSSSVAAAPIPMLLWLVKNLRTQSAARPGLVQQLLLGGMGADFRQESWLLRSVSIVLFQMFVRRVLVTGVHH